MYIVSMFYRDGSNYKFDVDFELTNEAFETAAGTYLNPGDPLRRLLDREEATIDYTVFGITESEFHEKIGYPHNSDDHPFVTITEIKIVPDHD